MSAIVGTALTVYLVVTSGATQIVLVTAIMVTLAWLLHKFFGGSSPEADI